MQRGARAQARTRTHPWQNDSRSRGSVTAMMEMTAERGEEVRLLTEGGCWSRSSSGTRGRDDVDRRRAPAVDEEDEDDDNELGVPLNHEEDEAEEEDVEELGVSGLGSFRLLALIEDEEDYAGGVGRR